tara:strand:+ start:279 stop:719 length:441 start_codon:yes stop_codon:yes gene_type:complete
MSKRFQRVVLIIGSLVFLLFSIILALFNIKNNVVFFFTPSELFNQEIESKNKIRIGGIVKKNSYKFNEENKQNFFIITDFKDEIKVYFIGIVPDLFKEGSGVVAEGSINNDILNAKKIFAKHDENYMPKKISKELKKSGYWKKEYE